MAFYLRLELSVGKISDRNRDSRFVGIYHGIGHSFSKMPLTLEKRPTGTYPSGVFHTSLGSTLPTESELESDGTVGNVSS